MTTNEITNYAQQSNKPEWFQSNESHIYACATSGSSTFNEWYEFENREQAIAYINNMFSSQSFIDRYTFHNGEFYEYDDCHWVENDDYSGDYIPNDDAEPVSIDELIVVQSRF